MVLVSPKYWPHSLYRGFALLCVSIFQEKLQELINRRVRKRERSTPFHLPLTQGEKTLPAETKQ